MQTVTVTIDEEGSLQYLVSDAAKCLLDQDTVVRRASHVEPDSPLLRCVFHGLRYIFGEDGTIGDLTRRMPCAWRVNTAPLGGPVLDEVWYNRQDAIDAEIEYINANLL